MTEVDENDETLKEKKIFLESSHILTLVLKVNLKLGFFPFGKILLLLTTFQDFECVCGEKFQDIYRRLSKNRQLGG